MNPVDIAIRNGWLQSRFDYQFPLILGWDVAGRVVKIGTAVTKFKVGDEVYSSPDLSRNGTYAEFVAVNETLVARKPSNLSFEGAASIPLVGITVYRALVEFGNIQEKQRVLILGGSGGVGTFAIQLAKSYGADVVATTSTKNIDYVKSIGADDVSDYTTGFPQSYTDTFDLVLDTVGRASFEQSYNLVRSGGKIVSIATFINEEDRKLADAKGIKLEFFFSDPSGEILSEITSLVEKDYIKPTVGAIFPLEQADKAHELSESKRAKGKIVLKINQEIL